jgi:hypothetical protein
MKMTVIEHPLTPPYHPSSNGQTERDVQIVKIALKARIKDTSTRINTLSLTHLLSDFFIKIQDNPTYHHWDCSV